MTGRAQAKAGLLLVAHGERRPGADNRSLMAHAAQIAAQWPGRWVRAAVLHGAPSLEQALRAAVDRHVQHLLVYPFFMSNGYIAGQVLPQRLRNLSPAPRISLMQPLGLEAHLRPMISSEGLRAAADRGFVPSRTRLLLVGHGSRLGGESAISLQRVVSNLKRRGVFATVESAFLEQQPFLRDRLKDDTRPTVVGGFFSGEGRHACQDVLAAVKEIGARAVYSGPIGAHPGIPGLISSAVIRRLRMAGAGAGEARHVDHAQ